MTTDVPPSRVALVTGAARGIGRALATGLAAQGVAVAVLGRRRAALEPVLREVRGCAVEAAAVEADVRDYDAVLAAVTAAAEALGRPIDLLVNNAGVIEPVEVPIWEADPGQWWDVVETDLRGPFHCIRAVVPGMVAAGGGRVVDLNSGAGGGDRAIYSANCAAKAALFRVSGNLHLAGHAAGIRAFEVSPGVVATDLTASMAMHAGRTEWTPPQAVVELVRALARGELDDWSGCYLRAGVDTVESLSAALPGRGEHDRRLRVLPFGPDDAAAP